MADYDVIVIGSGAGGMTAAVTLAQAGQRVLVLEKHYVPGGWCHSFTLQGHRFSPGVHYIGELQPGGIMRRIYEGLGVSQDMAFFELNPQGFDHTLIAGQRFDIPRGRERFAEALAARFPKEAEGAKSYLNLVQKVADELSAAMSFSGVTDILKAPLSLRNTLRYGLGSLDRVMSSFVEDPYLKAILSIQCGDHGLAPARVPFAMHASIAAHYFNGGYYPRGGGFTIPRAFLRALKRSGGELRLRASVSKILVQKDGRRRRAVGVRLEDGTEISAKLVISNADPHATFGRLVDQEHLSGRLQRRLQKTNYSISALSAFMAADFDARAAGLDSGNYWYSRTNDVGAGYRVDPDLESLLQRDLDAMFLTVTTLKDPTKRKDRLHTMEAFTFVDHDAFRAWTSSAFGDRPHEYEDMKRRLQDHIIDNLEPLVPGLREKLVFCELGTPLTNEHYVAATRGNLYGTDKTLWQIGPFAFQPRTEIPGLFLCGASTVAHGVAGATISGLVAASQILKCPVETLFERSGPELALHASDDPTDWPEALRARLARKSVEEPPTSASPATSVAPPVNEPRPAVHA